jgi:hypothetical protein
VYGLTDKGVAALAAEQTEWRRFAGAVHAVLGWPAKAGEIQTVLGWPVKADRIQVAPGWSS